MNVFECADCGKEWVMQGDHNEAYCPYCGHFSEFVLEGLEND